jgi:hypothetical protein
MVDAGAAHFDGVEISVLWSLPFAGLLLSIALLPLLTPHFWEHHFCKVAAFWVLAFLVPCAFADGFSIAAQAVLHTFLLDYVPFILLLFTLFVVAGGIKVSGNLVGTPLVLVSRDRGRLVLQSGNDGLQSLRGGGLVVLGEVEHQFEAVAVLADDSALLDHVVIDA